MEKPAVQHTWANFKPFFTLAQNTLCVQQHTLQQAGYHGANFGQQVLMENPFAGAADALNTCQTLSTFTEALKNLTNQLKAKEVEIQDLKNKQQRNCTKSFTDHGTYCWMYGYHIGKEHTSKMCKNPTTRHKEDTTCDNIMGGSILGKPTS